MIRRTVALLTLLILVLPAASVWPLGVGNIELRSALNEPLAARIPLRSVEAGDTDGMRVTLGTPEQFERAGVERPFVLTLLEFDVVNAASGAFVSVSSEQPITEPFLNFLIEVNWPRGRVIREYTVLLDPPVYGAAISSTVRQTVPVVDSPAAPTAPSQAAPSQAAPSQAPPPAAAPARSAAPGSYGPVTSSDTLWTLAQRFRPDGRYSIQQTMLAILAANPEAFIGNNINNLRAGVVLRIPSADEAAALGRAEAMAEVRRQHAAWEEMRSGVAAAPPPPAPQGAASAGDLPEGLTQPEPPPPAPAAATDESRLELVGAGSDATGVVGAPEQATNVEALRRDLNIALEEAEANRQRAEELSSRLTDAEALIIDLRRLVELKDESIAALQQELATQGEAPPPEAPLPEGASAPSTAPATTPLPAPEPPPAEAPPKPQVPLPPPPEPQPTSMFDILDALPVDPLLLGAGVGGLILIGALVAVMRRRRKAAADGAAETTERPELAEGDSMIEQYGRTQVPAEDAAPTELPTEERKASVGQDTMVDQDFAGDQTVVSKAGEAAREEEEDPLAEVNNYVAYEHFEQAEELCRKAIEQHPERHEYRQRLLEVLKMAGKPAAFAAAAAQLREVAGDDSPQVEQAMAWWSQLAPGREPFDATGFDGTDDPLSRTQSGADDADDDGIFDVTGATDASASSVDFDLGFEMTSSADAEELDSTQGGGSGLDFDLGGDEDTRKAEGDDVDLVLDDGGTADAAEESASGSDLDFDLGFGEESEDKTGADKAPPDDDLGLDFDLGEGVTEESGDTPGEDALDLDFEPGEPGAEAPRTDEELDFDLGDTGSGAEEPIEEVDIDLGDTVARAGGGDDEDDLDFDLGEAAEEDVEKAGADTAGDLDFDLGETAEEDVEKAGADTAGDLDFDLGETAEEDMPTADTEAKTPPAAPEPAGDEEFDLELDAGTGADEAVTETRKTGDDLDDFSFDLGEQGAETEQPGDEDLDFDLGELDEASEAGNATAGGADAPDADGLDFDFGDLDDDKAGGRSGADDGLDLDLGSDDDAESPTDEERASDLLDPSLETVRLKADEMPPTGEADAADDPLGLLDDEEPKGKGNLLESAVDRMDEDLDFDLGDSGADDLGGEGLDFDLDDAEGSADRGLSLDDESEDSDDKTLVLGRGAGGELDEVQTKLDLAQAYMDMGDEENARAILGEVMAEGSDAQKDEARGLLGKLS